MFNHLLIDRKIVVLSVAATGKDYKTHRIMQFGLLCLTPDDVPRVFATDVNPGIPIPAEATAKHGIGDEDGEHSFGFSRYASEIMYYLDGADLIGYDIKKFALPLLIKELERCGLKLSLHSRFVIDTLQFCREKKPLDLNEAFSLYCRKPLEKTGLPDRDVDAIALLLDSQLGRYPDLPRTITELHDESSTPDLLGLFSRGDSDLVFEFGKYRGSTLGRSRRLIVATYAGCSRAASSWKMCRGSSSFRWAWPFARKTRNNLVGVAFVGIGQVVSLSGLWPALAFYLV